MVEFEAAEFEVNESLGVCERCWGLGWGWRIRDVMLLMW